MIDNNIINLFDIKTYSNELLKYLKKIISSTMMRLKKLLSILKIQFLK